MANVLDYVKWRGDLSFLQDKPNIIDYFILSLVTIIDFRKCITKDEKITIYDLSKRYFSIEPNVNKLGLIIPNKIINLFKQVSKVNRYKNIYVERYVCNISLEEEKQFSALSFNISEKEIFIGFSGTDDTIIGWKENLDMMYKDFIPSQIDAIKYLDEIPCKEIIKCGGHSKGGNLALVASTFTNKNINKVFCFDSPGVNDDVFNSKEYNSIINKVLTVIPDSSIIGRMFNIPKNIKIVKSSQNGIYQHDPFTWEIIKTNFMFIGRDNIKVSEFTLKLNEIVKEMTLEEKKGFSEAMYMILKGNNNYLLLDLEGRVYSLVAGFFRLPRENRKYLIKPYKKLIKIKTFKDAFIKGFLKFRKSQKK